LSPALARRFTNVDFADRVAFVADCDGDIIAVARYDRSPGTDEAEVAFTVEDRHQGQGLATLLLEYLTAAAKEHHITCLVADVLPGNAPMLRVFREAAFAERVTLEDGVVRVALSIA
jgi:RimJ/RimL family protein N-acetyltransferase